MARFQHKIRDLTLKGKTSAREQAIKAHELNLHMAHVAGWEWEQGEDAEDGRPPFSHKELKDILNAGDVVSVLLKKFLDDEVGSLEDFLAKSEANLENV
jgi:hypothetical protein